jgi:alkylation response protein AidB-like acyl-CoA dehydrogenase
MDFTTTPEQDLLRDTARQLLGRECPPRVLRAHIDDPAAADPLWRQLREFAALGLGPSTDLSAFLFETGYVAAPGPFFATTALFAPLLQAIDHPAAEAVARGEVAGTAAIARMSGEWAPHGGTVKAFVLEADRVDLLAVVDDGPTVRVVHAADAGIRRLETIDPSRHICEVETGTGGETAAIDGRALDAVLDRACVALAAEMTGTARRLFDMTLEYAKHRHQFDVPIGSFQAIQHKLAEVALAIERATAAVQYAAMTVDADDPDRSRAAHVAKAAAGAAARRALKDGIQIHGGIGYTWEHDLHLFLRRATGDEHLLGSTGWHHDRIADVLFAPRS